MKNREYYLAQTVLKPSREEKAESNVMSKDLLGIKPENRGWMRDERERMQKHKATASLWHMVVSTPINSIKEILSEMNVSDYLNYMKHFDFYNALLNLSVVMDDPTRWSLEYARFWVALSENVKTLKISPFSQGIKATIKKYGERILTISPSLEFGASFEREITSEDKTASYNFSVGPKLGITGSYNRKKGWEIRYEKVIDEIRGVKYGVSTVLWDIYSDKSMKIPGGELGKTAIANTFLAFMVEKGSKARAKIKVEGKVLQDNWWIFDKRAPIKLIGPDDISMKPDIK